MLVFNRTTVEDTGRAKSASVAVSSYSVKTAPAKQPVYHAGVHPAFKCLGAANALAAAHAAWCCCAVSFRCLPRQLPPGRCSLPQQPESNFTDARPSRMYSSAAWQQAEPTTAHDPARKRQTTPTDRVYRGEVSWSCLARLYFHCSSRLTVGGRRRRYQLCPTHALNSLTTGADNEEILGFPRSSQVLGLSQLKLTHSTPAVPNRCCLKGSVPYWSNPSFLPERDYVTFGSLLSQFRLSVCRLSVCNVGAPYSGGRRFRQYFFTAVYAGHPLTSVQNFTEIVPGEPLRRER